MADYSEILGRLNAYRIKLNMSKRQMAKMFGVHSTHYGKLEAGSKRISYKSLACFAGNGGDVYQLFTGHACENGPIDSFLSKCRTDVGRKKLLNMIIASIDLGIWIDTVSQKKVSLDELPLTMHKSLRLMEMEGNDLTIWQRIRKIELLTQEQMAAKLDINVKRYRQIEKEKVKPNAEILYAVYCQLDYSPQLFLDRERFYIDELNHYWNRLSRKNRAYLESLLGSVIRKIAEKEP